MNDRKIILLCIIGIGSFFVLNVTITTFASMYNSPSHTITPSEFRAAEGQVEKEEGAHEQEGGEHRTEEEHHENGLNYSPLNPDEARIYSSNKTVSTTTATTPNNLSVASFMKQDSPIMGDPNAPVTVIEFGDFQCEFCARFAKVTEPTINATYFQTGKANMVFKHFVTHGEDSITAAIASQCTNEQDRFWNFYKLIYENQGPENSGWANKENMKK